MCVCTSENPPWFSLDFFEWPHDSLKSKQIPFHVVRRLWLPHLKSRPYLSEEWEEAFCSVLLGCYFWCHRILSDCVEPCQWRMCLCEKHWWGAFPQEDMYVRVWNGWNWGDIQCFSILPAGQKEVERACVYWLAPLRWFSVCMPISLPESVCVFALLPCFGAHAWDTACHAGGIFVRMCVCVCARAPAVILG